MRAVIYYCNKLPEIIRIINSIEEGGVLITNAKEAIEKENIFQDLYEIQNSYGKLVEVLDNFEDSKYTIKSGFKVLAELEFESDSLKIKDYISSR